MVTGSRRTGKVSASLVPNGSTYSPRLVFAKAGWGRGEQRRRNKEEILRVRLATSKFDKSEGQWRQQLSQSQRPEKGRNDAVVAQENIVGTAGLFFIKIFQCEFYSVLLVFVTFSKLLLAETLTARLFSNISFSFFASFWISFCVCVTSFCSTCSAVLRTSRSWVSCFLSSSWTCLI